MTTPEAGPAREGGAFYGGRQPCCGVTNRVCATPPGAAHLTNTGCARCGHPLGCHAWSWR